MSEEERRLYITKTWVVVIFFYYFALFICGGYFSLDVLLGGEIFKSDIFHRALSGSIAIALAASSVAYIRKLYKLCFKFSSDHDNDDPLVLKRLGTIVYFVARPLFAGLFAIVVVIGVYSGILLSTSPALRIENGFVYLTMASSFYVGFLSGEFIKRIETIGRDKLDKLVG